MKSKITIGAIAGAAALLALPPLASAHVTVTPTEAPADSYAKLVFSVPHGCDGSATTRVSVQIPESIPSVTPQRSPFWELSTKQGPKEEVELHGETITKGVSEVTWTATEPLPDDELDELGLEVKLPNEPGEELTFPAIQKCEQGETRWIEVPGPGETEDDLEAPAPVLALTEVAEEGHAAGEEPEGATEPGEGDEEATSDDDDSNGLSIAALVVGGLGLLAGGSSLIRGRK